MGCVDDGKDGNAYCFGDPPDGDESDGDEDEEEGDDDESDDDPPTDGDDDSDDNEPADDDAEICPDDGFEPNESVHLPAAIDPGYYENLTICNHFNGEERDEDWFAISLETGDEISAIVYFNHNLANLDLFLLDPGGDVVASSAGSFSDQETVHYAAAGAGAHILYIYATDRREAPYSLDVVVSAWLDGDEEIVIEEPEIEKEEIEICPDDAFEPNDDKFHPTPVSVIPYDGLILCPDNEDHYSVRPPVGRIVEIQIDFAHLEGDLDLMLYDRNGLQRQTSVSSSPTQNYEKLRFTADDDYYTFRVYSRVHQGNTYDLKLSVAPSAGCSNDIWEPNDDVFLATPVAAGELEGLVLCPFDLDVFAVEVQGGQGLKLEVLFSAAEGDLDAVLHTLNGLELASSTSADDNEIIIYNPETTQTLYLDVYSVDGVRTPYSLRTTILDSPICADDVFEENDSQASPAVLDGVTHLPDGYGVFSNLRICTDDPDWYRFTLKRNDWISATVLYDSPTSDIYMTIYDPADAPVAYFTEIPGGIEAKKKVSTAGDYTLLLRHTDPAEIPYQMTLSICTEDVNQGVNENLYSAVALTQSVTYPQMAICGGKDDWYSVNLGFGQTATMTVDFNADRGDVDLILYNGLGQIIKQSTSTGGVETISYTFTPAFPSVYFRVTSYGKRDLPYQLTFTLAP
ncbi:MAG: hypothetical protein C4523_16345 [Myxococcales bacterium]|nr:MAG: hypothetical protein C4523_16345 [Myxococcales bacterium]